MAEVVKRDEVKDILRHLHECKILLKKQNVYSCLLTFRDVLRRSLRTKMLPADMKFLLGEINIFQRELAEAKAYRDMFGPAAFRENDIKTTLDFIEMLISVKDEELKGAVENCHSDQIIDDSNAEEKTESMARQAKEALDQGDQVKARALLGADERVAALVFNMCNSAGIMFRKMGRPDQAVLEYRKALMIHPDDEGVYYNIARAYIELNDWTAAKEAVAAALRIAPDFPEGQRLLKYIERKDSTAHP